MDSMGGGVAGCIELYVELDRLCIELDSTLAVILAKYDICVTTLYHALTFSDMESRQFNSPVS